MPGEVAEIDSENAKLEERPQSRSLPAAASESAADKGGSSRFPGRTHSTFAGWFTRSSARRNRKALIVLNCFPECLSQQQQKETLLFGFKPSRPLGT